jgi:hypothetical protein
MHDIVIPIASHDEPGLLQYALAHGVGIHLVSVVSAIEFDDQLQLGTKEVDDVVAHWVLAAKLQAVETVGAQAKPESAFGVRGLGA